MISNAQALFDFAREFWDVTDTPPPDANLFELWGIDGDDGFDFIEKFSERFSVDVSNYRWYFHHAEEGWNFGGIFFAPPNGRVSQIPITLEILDEAISKGRWPINYPDHILPKARWDLRINLLLSLLFVGGLLALLVATLF